MSNRDQIASSVAVWIKVEDKSNFYSIIIFSRKHFFCHFRLMLKHIFLAFICNKIKFHFDHHHTPLDSIIFVSIADEDDDSEPSETEEEMPVKVRKVEVKPVGRRSKRPMFSDESENSDNEVAAKKHDDGSHRASRRVSTKSRKNSLEHEESSRNSRRSSKKVESPSERRASKRSLDVFNAISLSTLVDEIIKNKNAWPFTRPVSVSDVPDYFDVIKKPMDFGKIKSKLNLGDYRSNEQVMKDIELVFYNCDLYNNSSTEIYT